MKIATLILLSTISITSIKCTAQKQNLTATKQTNQKVTSAVEKITLEEMTRGTRKILEITSGSKVQTHNDAKTKLEVSMNEWNNIVKSVQALDLSKIHTYKSPTTARFYDGALASTIIINSGGKTYTSDSFDEGRPPQELAPLYKLLKPSKSK